MFAYSSGSNPPGPSRTFTCNDDHTVDITISNVDDIAQWTESEWQLESSSSCQPTFSSGTVTYTGLGLPDCAKSSEELADGSIKYVLEISPVVTDTRWSRSYEHMYAVSCTYDNKASRIVASFVPIKNRVDTDTDTPGLQST